MPTPPADGARRDDADALLPRGHVPELDGLRGLAVLLVVWFHAPVVGQGINAEPTILDVLYHRLRGAGWMGVDLFFVLSGFLITGILLDTKGRPRFLRNFVVRRTLRIFPLAWAFLLVMLGIALAVRDVPLLAAQSATFRESFWWLFFYGANVLAALRDFDALPFTSHLWSLAVEEQFYLVWPLVVLAVSRERLRALCVACIAGALLFRVGLYFMGPEFTRAAGYVLVPARLDSLGVGALLAALVRSPGGRAWLVRWCGPALWASVVVLATIAARHRLLTWYQHGMRTVGFTAVAIACAALLVLALRPETPVARLARASWLRFFGKYSYAIYLFHIPLVSLLDHFEPLVRPLPPTGTRVHFQLAYLALTVGLTTVLALLSWHGFEKHFLGLKDRWAPPSGHVGVPGAPTVPAAGGLSGDDAGDLVASAGTR